MAPVLRQEQGLGQIRVTNRAFSTRFKIDLEVVIASHVRPAVGATTGCHGLQESVASDDPDLPGKGS